VDCYHLSETLICFAQLLPLSSFQFRLLSYCPRTVVHQLLKVVTRHLLSAPGRTFHCIASVCMAFWHSQSLAQWPSMLTQISCMTLQSTRQHWTV